MDKRKTILTLYLLLYGMAFAVHNAINLGQLSITDGLSSGSITCILQDSKGFIWIGTEDGLNKYDGYQLSIYRHDPENSNSIGGNSVRCLFEDSRNNLWIGLKGDGLCRLDLKTGEYSSFRHNKTKNSISYNDVSGIVEDKQGRLWIAVDRGGLDMFDPQTGNFTHYPLMESRFKQSLNNALTDIVLDERGNIWLSSWGGGVYCFNVENKYFSIHPYWEGEAPEETVCKHILSLHMDREGLLWVCSAHGGLYVLNGTKHHRKSISDSNQIIRAVCEDDTGRLWLATSNEGIKILDKKTGQTLHIQANGNAEKQLLSNNINCIYRDKNGMIWIGTPIGVNFYSPLLSQFSLTKKEYSNPNSLSENHVLSLLKDRKGNVWVGGINGVDKILPNGKKIKRYLSGEVFEGTEPFRFNQAICEDHNGNIWMGGYGAYLMKYNPQKDSFEKIKIPPPQNTDFSYRNIYHIYEDWDRSLWLATELGTLHYNPSKKIFTPLFESKQIIYPDEKSHVVYRDQYMELWVGTEKGLRHYDRNLKLKHNYTTLDSIAKPITNNFITDIYEDSGDILWIGTMGGLHRFKKKERSFELIKRPGIAYGDPIFGICKDSSGCLWISTTYGILKYDTQTAAFHIYNESDGLQSKDFQLRAFFQADDGELFFGGKDGFNTFYPHKLKTNKHKPSVIITDMLVFNEAVTPQKSNILSRSISETKHISISHQESVVSFKFVAPNYISPQKNRYAYKMEGFDRNWIETSADRRIATYTNLDPGNYSFKVKASNNDGVWNEEAVKLDITIRPPFWKTGYAYTIYTLLLITIIYLIIRYFTIRERDKNKLRISEMEAERVREMERMKVNLFTNVSHEFRTPLSLILGPLTQIIEQKNYKPEDENLYTLMHRNAQRLLRLINQLLDFRKIEAGKLELNLKYDNVIKFINNLAATFSFHAAEKDIRYAIISTTPDLWMNFDPDKLDKILYNLLSNAFHYTEAGGKVEVSVSEVIIEGQKYLQIQVKDTGIGIPASEMESLFTLFYQGKQHKKIRNGGSGIGLALVKGLVDLHRGKINVESVLNQGSCFTVQLPVDQTEKLRTVIEHSSEEELKEQNENKHNTIENNELDIILIIEDDTDMRNYISNILRKQFQIILAKDGSEGLKIALDLIPDLIVSDIMMPSMDGIEMLKALRNNDKSNHIPVILLTSLHNEAQVLESYEVGADDYITKPFSPSILNARIQNLLLSRKKMWEQYKQSENLNEYEEKLSENPQKQAFIKKVNEIIMAHIADSEFNIEILAEELKMSVNQLFRKVKALMDTTPYNLIIQIRMTHAAQLLKGGNHNVSEIAFAVGYQELSNFSRAFKKYFNVSPRDFLTKPSHN